MYGVALRIAPQQIPCRSLPAASVHWAIQKQDASMVLHFIVMTSLPLCDLNRLWGPFDKCVEFQKQSQELVIFSPTAGQVVRIAWCVISQFCYCFHVDHFWNRPMLKKKWIVPKGIKDWLRLHGLHWACFCALIADHGSSTSIQIVQSMGDGKVHVFCSLYPPKCHFYCKHLAFAWYYDLTFHSESR